MTNNHKKLKRVLNTRLFNHHETIIKEPISQNSEEFFVTNIKNSFNENFHLIIKKKHEQSKNIKSKHAFSKTIFSRTENFNHNSQSQINLLKSSDYKIDNNNPIQQKSQIVKNTTENDINIGSNKIFIKNHLNFLQYLNYTEKTSIFKDKKTFFNKTFLKNSQFDLTNSENQTSYNIFFDEKKRGSFINDLNHRLYYKKRSVKSEYPLNLYPKNSTIKSQNEDNNIMNLSILQRRSTLNLTTSPKNSNSNELKKPKKMREALARLTPINTSIKPQFKVCNYALPSSERQRYKFDPLLLLKDISDHINTIKSYNANKNSLAKISDFFEFNQEIKSCFYDNQKNNLIEPLSPRGLFSRIFIMEQTKKKKGILNEDFYNTIKTIKKRGNLKKTLYWHSSYNKISEESFKFLFEINLKLEELRINFEKNEMENMKHKILEHHESILKTEFNFLEKLKKNKIRKSFIKKEIENCGKLNINVPSSDIMKNIDRCEDRLGKLKFIPKTYLSSLRNMEDTIYEIKNKEFEINEDAR